MKIFLAGSSGSTGKLLASQLLGRGHQIVTVVRNIDSLPKEFDNHENLTIIQASLLELSDTKLSQLVKDCQGIASCLGHNLSLKGIYGHPRLLVTEATRRLCLAIKANQPQEPVRYVLMNTVGNRNRNLDENLHGANSL